MSTNQYINVVRSISKIGHVGTSIFSTKRNLAKDESPSQHPTMFYNRRGRQVTYHNKIKKWHIERAQLVFAQPIVCVSKIKNQEAPKPLHFDVLFLCLLPRVRTQFTFLILLGHSPRTCNAEVSQLACITHGKLCLSKKTWEWNFGE